MLLSDRFILAVTALAALGASSFADAFRGVMWIGASVAALSRNNALLGIASVRAFERSLVARVSCRADSESSCVASKKRERVKELIGAVSLGAFLALCASEPSTAFGDQLAAARHNSRNEPGESRRSAAFVQSAIGSLVSGNAAPCDRWMISLNEGCAKAGTPALCERGIEPDEWSRWAMLAHPVIGSLDPATADEYDR